MRYSILIAAGGTAGHINPALAVADKFREVFPESRILFVGTPGGLESKLVTKSGYDFVSVKLGGLQRGFSLSDIKRNAQAAFQLVFSKSKIIRIIKDFEPNFAIGTGGYVCYPVLKAASSMGVKTAVHESNAFPGMSVRLLSKAVGKVFVGDAAAIDSFPSKYRSKCIVTGNPLRSGAEVMNRESAHRKLGLNPDNITILSFGGSMGSKTLTESAAALIAFEYERGGFNHIHACGKNGTDFFGAALKKHGVQIDTSVTIVQDYIYNMYVCLSAADLVISRSGSMSQTELKHFGKASVQIPWSGASENHQYLNAVSMEKAGAAVVITDKELTSDNLIQTVKSLVQDKKKLAGMGRAARQMSFDDAAGMVVSEMLTIYST